MNPEELEEKLAKSEKERAELAARVTLLSDFVENASVPMHWVNGSGIIIWANQAELNVVGYTKEEYVGRHISNFHADKENCDNILNRLINKETLKDYPAKLICKNGDLKDVVINSNALWNENTFIHTRCFTREVAI